MNRATKMGFLRIAIQGATDVITVLKGIGEDELAAKFAIPTSDIVSRCAEILGSAQGDQLAAEVRDSAEKVKKEYFK